jgi:hypothetical protein
MRIGARMGRRLVPMALFLAGSAILRTEPVRIRFSGYDWLVKDSGGSRVGPGPNYFSKDSVRVDPEGLKLRVFERDGRRFCAEIISAASFGYGTYSFEVASNVERLADDLILGLFTWSDDPGDEGFHKELDVEIGRWGDPANPIGQFVLQPMTRPGNIVRFALPAAAASTHSFTWKPQSVRFVSTARGRIVQEHVFTRRSPVPDKEKVHLNLWISSRIPSAGETEVTIRSFKFEPAR